MKTLNVGENNVVRWNGLMDLFAEPHEYINDATLTMSLTELDGTAVDNGTDLTLSYVTGSNGDYHGIVPKTVELVADTQYLLIVNADDADGLRTVICIAKNHGET